MKRILSIGKDDFYPQIFRLAVPIIIQNLLSAAVNSADVIMLNYVGQSAISAVSLAANYSIFYLWCIMASVPEPLFCAPNMPVKRIFRRFM